MMGKIKDCGLKFVWIGVLIVSVPNFEGEL